MSIVFFADSRASALPFNPNDYVFLVYDCGNGEIQTAMGVLGISYTLRNTNNPVTAQDLIDHDILIVGWKKVALTTSGLSPAIIEAGIGIGSRVILTGHDADWHTADNRWEQPYAEKFLSQCIGYILEGDGTGLLALAESVDGFDWVPEIWGIETTDGLTSEKISTFTPAGLDSGVFDGLTTDNMSDWSYSFHNTFELYGIEFRPFEMGMVNDVNSVVTIAATINPYGVVFEKVDDVDGLDCVGPGDELTYTICWEEIGGITLENVKIIDYLPAGVTHAGGYWETDPLRWIEDTNYDPNTHTYTWDIGTVEPNDPNCVSLTVTINEWSVPGIELYNAAELVIDGDVVMRAYEDTLVCCWDTVEPNIIYVDSQATGYNNGTNWDDAYVDLQDALYLAADSNCVDGGYTIRVAQGTYSPGGDAADTFKLPKRVEIHGGYKTGGDERDIGLYETIFEGFISDNGHDIIRNNSVVTMGYQSMLDGVTVTQGEKGVSGDGSDFTVRNCNIEENSQYGIYVKDCDAVIENCKITDGQKWGIYAQDGDVTVKWCSITNNEWHGIEHKGTGYSLTVENSQVKRNGQHGIFTDGSIPSVKNSIIASNGTIDRTFYGMLIFNPAGDPILHNNTIVCNAIEGISFFDNAGSNQPDIQNCIVYFNNDGSDQMAGMIVDDVAEYSCVQNCNEVSNNINDVPGFAYTVDHNDPMPYADNYHLAYNSPCVDSDNSAIVIGPDDKDIDGEDRIYGSSVDIGADEVYSCEGNLTEDDVYNGLDWNADGIVNYEEFEYFSLAWLSHDPYEFGDPNLADPDEIANWNPICNLDADPNGTSQYDIGMADMDIFVDSWLWVACWKQSDMDRVESMMMAMGGGESMMMMPMSMEYSAPITVEQDTPTLEEQAAQLVKTLDWLDEIWLDPEVQETIGEDRWLDFVESVEESLVDIAEQQE